MLNGRRTSIRLEPVFWDALEKIAEKKRTTINQLAEGAALREEYTLTSRVRAFILCEAMGR